MPTKLKLSIQQPCHENWQEMTASEQGRFCQACAKEVVDFTGMSDTEVLHYFLHHKRESVCGRLYNDQLNREITKPDYSRKKLSWYWNYVVMVFLVLFKGNTGKAQTAIKPVTLQEAFNDDTVLRTVTLGGISVGSEINRNIAGQVIDKDEHPLAGVVVQLKGKTGMTITDANGHYELTNVSGEDILKFNAVGFCSREVKAGSSAARSCTLQQQSMGLVEVTAGLISTDEEYAASPSLHVAELEVLDAANNQPVRATISFSRGDDDETDAAQTNSKGIYRIRQIKEQEEITVTISAEGYTDTSFSIQGWKFNTRKETRYVFLKKKQEAAIEQKILVGGVTSVIANPLYILDGKVANPIDIAQLDKDLVQDIQVLKPPTSTVIYGEAANAGAIIITTKKQMPVNKKSATEKDYSNEAPVKNIVISPNPVRTGGTVSLSFTSPLEGEYQLMVGTADGRVIEQRKITARVKQYQLVLPMDSLWTSGWYYINIVDSKGRLSHSGSFVIE